MDPEILNDEEVLDAPAVEVDETPTEVAPVLEDEAVAEMPELSEDAEVEPEA
jgi:hypothetical protein